MLSSSFTRPSLDKNHSAFLMDYTIEENMFREVYEDIVYVLLNLILADTINKYIKKK